ncbi:hypothetical protein D3C84_891520 [compost metagenome]
MGEQRLGVLGRVVHGEQVEHQVVLLVLERAGGRQDDVGMAGGLVQVEIHRDHELQLLQRLLQLTAIG